MIPKNKILELESRRIIYNFIDKNPGTYQSEIAKKLKIPRSTLNYHIRHLINQNLVSENLNGSYRRYNTTEKIGKKEQELLIFLREEVPRNILFYLMGHVVCSEIELSKELDKKPPTIDFHLKKLLALNVIKITSVKNGLVCRNRDSYYMNRRPKKSEKFYVIKDTKTADILYKLFIRYEKSLLKDEIYSNILQMVEEVKDAKRKKVINCSSKNIDNVFEVYYDVMPHPYHV